MHLFDAFRILIGGVVLWSVNFCAGVATRHVALVIYANAYTGAPHPAYPPQAATPRIRRELKNFAISLLIALGILVLQTLLGEPGISGILFVGVILTIPASHNMGRWQERGYPQAGVVRGTGLVLAGIAAAAAMYGLGLLKLR